MEFGLCFKRCIKDVIMGKMHFNEDLNHSQGWACFVRNVNHSQRFERNMKGKAHSDKNVSRN
jgi:hypothetical protein